MREAALSCGKMPPRKRAPQQRKPRSRRGLWLLLLVVLAGVAAYFYRDQLRAWYRSHSSASKQVTYGEATYIADVRSICGANVSFQYANAKQGYARSLKELADAKLIDQRLATGSKDGYRYEYVGTRGKNGLIEQYRLTARPEQHSSKPQRSLYTDDSCELHTTLEDRAATSHDPILK